LLHFLPHPFFLFFPSLSLPFTCCRSRSRRNRMRSFSGQIGEWLFFFFFFFSFFLWLDRRHAAHEENCKKHEMVAGLMVAAFLLPFFFSFFFFSLTLLRRFFPSFGCTTGWAKPRLEPGSQDFSPLLPPFFFSFPLLSGVSADRKAKKNLFPFPFSPLPLSPLPRAIPATSGRKRGEIG